MTVRLLVIYLSEEVKRPLLLHYFIYHKTIGALLRCKRCPFAWEKVPFWRVKDALLQRKRRPFRT